MDIRAAEISAILKEQIKNFGQDATAFSKTPRAVMVDGMSGDRKYGEANQDRKHRH